eukprot:2092576-Amphidinium_carterae.1
MRIVHMDCFRLYQLLDWLLQTWRARHAPTLHCEATKCRLMMSTCNTNGLLTHILAWGALCTAACQRQYLLTWFVVDFIKVALDSVNLIMWANTHEIFRRALHIMRRPCR